MKATVFQSLNKIYKLDIPSRRSLPDRIWIHIQSLALSFYKVLFQDKIKTPILKAIVNNRYLPSQSIRQSYTNLFYSLNNKCQRVLDFIACIICLLSDVLFTSKHAQASQKVTQFLQQIQRSGQKLREYLYILYTFQTLGLTVGKQSANVLFHKYILSISEFSSSVTSRTRINMQMKELKKNMQDRIQMVNIKQRLKKVARDKKVSIYKEQLDIILLKNKLQLEQENRNNRKFQKLLKRCITQGLEEIDLSLTKKQLSSLKLNDILKTMKNTQKTFRARKRNEKQDQSKSYEHWKKIVEDMKTFCELGNTVMIESLSSPHRLIKQAHYHIPNENQTKKTRYLIDPMMLKKSKISNKDLHCHKTAIKYNSMLPEIRENRSNVMTEPNDKLQVLKGKQNRSKQYRHQYNRFLTQRARKRIV